MKLKLSTEVLDPKGEPFKNIKYGYVYRQSEDGELKEILDGSGKPLYIGKGDGTILTIKDMLELSLNFEDYKIEPEEKYQRHLILKKIYSGDDEIELKSEQITTCKKAVGKFYASSSMMGAGWDILDHGK